MLGVDVNGQALLLGIGDLLAAKSSIALPVQAPPAQYPSLIGSELIRTHHVNTVRRGVLALVTVLIGLVVTSIGVAGLVLSGSSSNILSSALPGLATGCGAGLLLIGGIVGWRSLTWRRESFDVHEGGLVHVYGTHRRPVAWTEMTKVVDVGNDRGLSPLLGGTVNCRIDVAGGKRLAFTALTEDAAELLATVRHAADPSVRAPEDP